MALTNNLVLSKTDNRALSELLSARQPGDKLQLCVHVTIVENLTDRASFDVTKAEGMDGGREYGNDVDERMGKMSPLAQSVLGVMAKKKSA